MIDRRTLMHSGMMLATSGAAISFSTKLALAETVTLPFGNGERPLIKYPQKRPLIGLTSRPPQLETPFSVFNEGVITPNDAFFVRYHLADIPLEIDPDTFSVEIKGKVDKPLKLSLAEIKKMPAIELVAVNQCSGNSRGFFYPRVGGGQLANGAMGNARWKGVSLKAVLDEAGMQAGAKQVVFGALDGPVSDRTPDFAKALDVDHARDGDVILAYAMNGEDLPVLNGYPLRLIVPGYYGTYWVKHLNEITVIDTVFDNFWMKSAYRIPDNDCNCVKPGTAPKATIPINKFTVRSFLTSLVDGAKVKAGAETPLRGIAFDGGSGIKEVAVSTDGGQTWTPSRLGENLGRYSFREWTLMVKLPAGAHELKVRATSNDGQTQPLQPLWNPAGYLRNVVETYRIVAA
ncbi:SorA family sulfite dehydrogenase catalytic subunit [Bradyrhizobium japonicum]|uniref:SorA family sulfite dehydrogenase catalytic subunit n=1 Tax=Bradyrhizobium japonicum TaxID=375 RepID=UPI00209C9C7E|nr:molybdopterin-dependent oxidoreductase [Bradyrhizobium japonicum]MCP1768550.1 DMSO/TMAO reductase YedYZ molybdopterin-dependent catalytic subunit [Bradyrhizobium japonicum]MCP1794711.1 DMSO/TMAO reductase YedYZ molybdopterin-dependent catalytic subunit [Bradyrhizobium japonicum]MCP1811023.1 DMSO/TMAO reductase YedYZ molybdopterin-dependent catalytic subunit [Bradyrhizobium japonicum]MCP1821124.1 DMSO/TMAO reductase YedYZ molybdopterin-dependent catalytic subunit [Bradyrhizobium japonicum]MC